MSVAYRAIQFVVVCVAMLLSCGSLWAASSVSQLYLVQNSGWMLPFYDDPASRLKDIVTELSARVRKQGGGQQILASFNQSSGENKSPVLHYQGDDQNKFNQSLALIQPARKPGKATYADTDFKEAIVGAVTNYTPGKPCIIWIITNNKNSPDNSTETVERNKEFYRFLQDTAEIKRIVAFPYALKVQSKSQPNFRANGLMIYAMAYGSDADQLLQQMISTNAVFGKQPARLKPLNAEALTFIPKGVKGSGDVKATIPDRKTLVLSFDAKSKPDVAEIRGTLRNDFYPYDIRSATVGMTSGLQGGKGGITSHLSNNTVTNIPAGGESSDIIVKITVPPIPSPWSPEVVLGSGYRANGYLQFELANQQLGISKEFVQSMADIFPNDPLPDLFVPGESAKRSVTKQPLLVQVVYPSWPIIVVGGLLLLMLAAVIAGLIIIRREKVYRVSVDGVQKPYGLRPFGEVVIKDAEGSRVGVLKRAFGKPDAILDKGKSCVVRIM